MLQKIVIRKYKPKLINFSLYIIANNYNFNQILINYHKHKRRIISQYILFYQRRKTTIEITYIYQLKLRVNIHIEGKTFYVFFEMNVPCYEKGFYRNFFLFCKNVKSEHIFVLVCFCVRFLDLKISCCKKSFRQSWALKRTVVPINKKWQFSDLTDTKKISFKSPSITSFTVGLFSYQRYRIKFLKHQGVFSLIMSYI